MFVPPSGPSSLKYWKTEAEYRQSQAGRGSITLELARLSWYLVKGIIWVLVLPVRLSLSWWLKQRRRRARVL